MITDKTEIEYTERLEILPKQAKEKVLETKKFFNKIKKRVPKKLDIKVAEIHEDVFSETDCTLCANCCKTTSPLFNKQDVDRISKYLGLKPAQFEQEYLLIDNDNDVVLKKTPCAFLENNNCSIYSVRPKACREFPHTNRKKVYQIADLTIANTFICPAAFDIVERMKSLVKV